MTVLCACLQYGALMFVRGNVLIASELFVELFTNSTSIDLCFLKKINLFISLLLLMECTENR